MKKGIVKSEVSLAIDLKTEQMTSRPEILPAKQ